MQLVQQTNKQTNKRDSYDMTDRPTSLNVLVVNIKDRWTTLKSSQLRYVKPTLKKVSKYENKFAKLQKKVTL